MEGWLDGQRNEKTEVGPAQGMRIGLHRGPPSATWVWHLAPASPAEMLM